jgi:lipid-A-disaccharide synthase
MRPYVDHLLALLPFEPEAHIRLGGPPCTYVGHPLIEKLDWADALDADELRARLDLTPGLPVLVALPGSRPTEVRRLMHPFGEAIRELRATHGPLEVILPAVPSVRPLIEEGLLSWPQQPYLVEGDCDKWKAFKLADVALAASGTVTLELGLAGTPMVVAYRVDGIAARLRFLLKVPSVVLANLVLGENAFPEMLQEECTPQHLSSALKPLLADTNERRVQLAALARLRTVMTAEGLIPSQRAADIVLRYLAPKSQRRSRFKATRLRRAS